MNTKSKLRLAKVAYLTLHWLRRLIGRSDRVRVRRFGLSWYLDLREGIDLSIYLLGRFEARTCRKLRTLIQPGATVLDVGANIGAHTLPLAEMVGPDGLVVAFEPTRFALEKLSRNVSLNPSLQPRIRLEQVQLDEPDAALLPSIYSSWSLSGNADRHDVHGGALKGTDGARVSTLDDYVESLARWPVALIKLDVDGNELRVLKGATRMFAEHRPIVCFELAPGGYEDTGSPGMDLLRFFGENNYVVCDLNHDRTLPETEEGLMAITSRGGSINVLAYPLESQPEGWKRWNHKEKWPP